MPQNKYNRFKNKFNYFDICESFYNINGIFIIGAT